MRNLLKVGVVCGAVIAMMSACSGGGSSYGSTGSTPTTPSSPSTASGATVVSIVGSSGTAAFQPNPVSAQVGSALQWKNDDVVAHHIVLDDGSADLGTLAPGGVSATVTVAGTSPVGFHCTIHPSMVGTINGSSASMDPGMQYSVGEQRARGN